MIFLKVTLVVQVDFVPVAKVVRNVVEMEIVNQMLMEANWCVGKWKIHCFIEADKGNY